MSTAPTRLEDQVFAATDQLATYLARLTEEPYLRDAIAKMVTREISWALVRQLDISPYDLADDLEVMASVLRDDAREQRQAQVATIAEAAIAAHASVSEDTPDLFAGSTPSGAA